MIAYATQPDNVAMDGEGRNSPFTTALLKYIQTPGLEVSSLMKRVRSDVVAATCDRQVPWDHSSLMGDVVRCRATAVRNRRAVTGGAAAVRVAARSFVGQSGARAGASHYAHAGENAGQLAGLDPGNPEEGAPDRPIAAQRVGADR